MIDYYELLEVSPKASQEVIKAVYKILIQRYDSDKSSNDPETDQKIIALKLAYEVLSDFEKRKAYDSEISRLKPDQLVDTVRNESNVSNFIPRSNWNRLGWILSILAVVILLFSMVRPEPEKVKRGQLAVKLEADREKEELEAKLRKQASEAKRADTVENE